MRNTATIFSANLSQLRLTQYDRGELNDEEAEASVIVDYEARIAALEWKVRHPMQTAGGEERFFVISGPLAAPSDGGAKP